MVTLPSGYLSIVGTTPEFCRWYLRQDVRCIIAIKYDFKNYLPFIPSRGIKLPLIDFERLKGKVFVLPPAARRG